MIQWAAVALAGKWDSSVCLDTPPDPPSQRVQATYDPEDPPLALVPLAYARSGTVPPRGRWYDERGRVYPFDEVERALLDHPLAAPRYDQFRTESDEVSYELAGVAGHVQRLAEPGREGVYDGRFLHHDLQGALAGYVMITDDESGSFLQAVCLFNLTQPERVARERAAEAELAAVIRARRPEDPPVAAWAVTGQVYGAIGAARPEDLERWRADVALVWAALQAGEDPDALLARVSAAAGDTLEARLGP